MHTRKSLQALAFVALFGAAAAGLTSGGRVGKVRAAVREATQVVASGLNNPRGLSFGPDGALYVTNNSIFSGTGEVLRIEP